MLKTFAANYISMQENLSTADKITLLKFVKEATVDEVKSLLITGQYEVQQESVKQFDNKFGILFEFAPGELEDLGLRGTMGGIKGGIRTGVVNMNKLLKYIQDKSKEAEWAGKQQGIEIGRSDVMHQAGVGLAAVAVAALVLTVAHATYKRFLSKAARACKGLSGDNKTSCMNRYKREATKKQVSDLTLGIQGCSKTKNPLKCKQKIGNKINKLKAQLGTL
jgi:hypothetical protein